MQGPSISHPVVYNRDTAHGAVPVLAKTRIAQYGPDRYGDLISFAIVN